MLTKELCEKAVKNIAYELCRNPKLTKWCQIDGQDRKKLKRGLQRKIDLLKQLINEHFDNNNARTVQNLVSEIDKLEKALDKACEKLEEFANTYEDRGYCDEPFEKEQWKEWLLDEVKE